MTPPPVLLDDQVQLRHFCLDTMPAEEALGCLSADEVARAARWHRLRDRDRFIVGRAWLRRTLASYLDTAAEALAFDAGTLGKPMLRPPHHALQFNLSHSGGVALLAISRAGEVGADVEAVQPMHDMAAIAHRHFAPAEWRCWRQLPARDRQRAFYACWTRKEAFVKALGGGLLMPLDGFEVELDPARPAALLSVAGSTAVAAQWSLWSVDLEGHIAAVVVRGTGLRLIDLGEG